MLCCVCWQPAHHIHRVSVPRPYLNASTLSLCAAMWALLLLQIPSAKASSTTTASTRRGPSACVYPAESYLRCSSVFHAFPGVELHHQVNRISTSVCHRHKCSWQNYRTVRWAVGEISQVQGPSRLRPRPTTRGWATERLHPLSRSVAF